MIPSTDPRTSATPQLAPHVPPADFLRGPGDPLHRVDHLAQLSAMVDYLRVLQQHYGADRRLYSRARHAAARVQALAHALGAASSADPAHCPSSAATEPASQAARDELEAAFRRWLTDPLEADVIHLDGHDPSPRPLREVLGALCASRRPLSGEVAAALGMPAGTTIGQAASELRHAVDDPSGPRCRSYRAAVYYLRDLDRITLDAAELEPALP